MKTQENREYSTELIEENKAQERELISVNTYVEELERGLDYFRLENKNLEQCLINLGLSLDDIPNIKMGRKYE